VANPYFAAKNDKSVLVLPGIRMGFECPQMCQICVRFFRVTH
jgi:hypothetical protein